MLSVGREINIGTKDVVCRSCAWQGAGEQLGAGLCRINREPIYLYAYRCPACSSFDVARPGKLLAFRLRDPAARQEEAEPGVRQRAGNGGESSRWK